MAMVTRLWFYQSYYYIFGNIIYSWYSPLFRNYRTKDIYISVKIMYDLASHSSKEWGEIITLIFRWSLLAILHDVGKKEHCDSPYLSSYTDTASLTRWMSDEKAQGKGILVDGSFSSTHCSSHVEKSARVGIAWILAASKRRVVFFLFFSQYS